MTAFFVWFTALSVSLPFLLTGLFQWSVYMFPHPGVVTWGHQVISTRRPCGVTDSLCMAVIPYQRNCLFVIGVKKQTLTSKWPGDWGRLEWWVAIVCYDYHGVENTAVAVTLSLCLAAFNLRNLVNIAFWFCRCCFTLAEWLEKNVSNIYVNCVNNYLIRRKSILLFPTLL